jgi:hypothetical protein
MSEFESSNLYPAQNSSKEVTKNFLNTKKYLLLRQNFIEFQDWSLEKEEVILSAENREMDRLRDNDFNPEEFMEDDELGEELAQLFAIEAALTDEELLDELDRLEEYMVESKPALVTCPTNMPQWENAWWGERALTELEYHLRTQAIAS